MNWEAVPIFARDYPEVAKDLNQARLPFYCCNCYRKRETTYITPNFGPFCRQCVDELKKALLDGLNA